MVKNENRIGFGGGCHWCTEAVFQSIRGVTDVEQGYISSFGDKVSFSEGVIVHFDPAIIPLGMLLKIYLHTHQSTVKHSMRDKYRSAVYCFSQEQFTEAKIRLNSLQAEFDHSLITEVLYLNKFQLSREALKDYYKSDPDRPFCRRYIIPKLDLLKEKFSKHFESQ